MIRPVVEQPMYNIFDRPRVEGDFQILFDRYKLGLTTYSPLAYGVMSGSPRRMSHQKARGLPARAFTASAQLSLAWCVSKENVLTVMLGARTVEQLGETWTRSHSWTRPRRRSRLTSTRRSSTSPSPRSLRPRTLLLVFAACIYKDLAWRHNRQQARE